MERIADVSSRRAVRARGIEEEPWGEGLELRRRRYGAMRAAVGRPLGVSAHRTLRLDAVSAQAWALMDGSRTVREVQRQIVAAYPGTPDVATRLGRLVGLLVSEGFLRLE